ncbi:MAG: AAA family ATPase [Candidatus Aminicenantes bacterium]|nr:AAA family ATPase [Candidatus Aminicenantes bacterium]NIM82756.1 AAA family ATPase [Candidatus Aminicenantes bacterium]NIN19320.1 AAA family ATPase [Candidatus Aminicenantes bacterium]NIN45892.1 AAA family ATPase [Candidatus Aminicenantes bacterium]NIN90864.1 AAA family ATPase [Candidatus Aminicenantes bacterium]
MSEKEIKKIPYGLANYGRLLQKNCYYVDKTMYLKAVEDAGDYLFFIRPRRFGKSLFLSVMEAYYDVYYKDRFEEFFKERSIFKQPTRERGGYLVLKLNFSMVDPDVDKVEASFLNHIRLTSLSFLRKYADCLLKDVEYYKKIIEESRSPSDILSIIADLCRDSHQKSYAIIDEYDNFANTILSTVGEDAYRNLTHGEGFFKSFFNVLKGGTDGIEAPFTRLFLTGVSPVTLDDVTSGFNIGENVSLDSTFNQMLGFTREDAREMLNYYKTAGLIKHHCDDLMEIIDRWYGNYLFSEHSSPGDKLYNPDMVLYFLKEYFKIQSIPDDLIDRNVRIDYGKLRHLIIVDSGKGKPPAPNGNFNRLKEIIEKGGTSSKLVKGFPLEELVDAKNFISLLFYLGLLTIESPEKDKIRLKIPNETVKRLYYDYIEKGYRETDIFDLDLSKYSDLISDMAYDGKWEPFFKLITSRMQESMSLRDLITGEKSIQAFLNVYLGLSQLYIIHTEKEFNKGYTDIFMEPFTARYEGIKYSYLLEIKYMKAGAKKGDAEIQKLKTKAEEQLAKYSIDEKLRKNIEKTTLIKLVLVFSGHELMYIGDVK